jgi:hypothetical protein
MRRTYLDTGVLIEAAAGKGPKAEVALAVLRDPTRAFLSCPFLDLELLPQTILNRNRLQQRFLETRSVQMRLGRQNSARIKRKPRMHANARESVPFRFASIRVHSQLELYSRSFAA